MIRCGSTAKTHTVTFIFDVMTQFYYECYYRLVHLLKGNNAATARASFSTFCVFNHRIIDITCDFEHKMKQTKMHL